MITAENFREKLELRGSEKSKILDIWLESEVLPKFEKNNQGFAKPDTITLEETVTLLKARGFAVTSNTIYQGSFVYISLPPKGE